MQDRTNTICRAQQTHGDIFFIRSGLLLYTLRDQCSFDRYKLCIYTCHFDNNTQIDREQSCPVPGAQRMKLLVSNSTLAKQDAHNGSHVAKENDKVDTPALFSSLLFADMLNGETKKADGISSQFKLCHFK